MLTSVRPPRIAVSLLFRFISLLPSGPGTRAWVLHDRADISSEEGTERANFSADLNIDLPFTDFFVIGSESVNAPVSLHDNLCAESGTSTLVVGREFPPELVQTDEGHGATMKVGPEEQKMFDECMSIGMVANTGPLDSGDCAPCDSHIETE